MLIKRTIFTLLLSAAVSIGGIVASGDAALVTNPNDPRTWQAADVGTFANLYYGSDTPANRQLVIDNQLLDDGIFNATGYTAATLMSTPWTISGGGCLGTSTGTTAGDYSYSCNGSNVFTNANSIDNLWFQTSGTVGQTVFDLGNPSSKAAIFNSIDHGPLPQEAIESTVYLSNDLTNWTQAVTERVWLEGFNPNLGVQWDGFVYAVGTGTNSTFRYASIIWGGPGALISDGDNEINGVMGLNSNYTPSVPEPATLLLMLSGVAGVYFMRKRV